MKSVSVLSSLTEGQRETLASALEEAVFEDGEVIALRGEPADALHIVKAGELALHGKHHEAQRLRAGGFFGEAALLVESHAVLEVDAVAAGQATVLKLSRESFTSMLGDLREVVSQNFNRSVLSGMDMFKALTRHAVNLAAFELTSKNGLKV